MNPFSHATELAEDFSDVLVDEHHDGDDGAFGHSRRCFAVVVLRVDLGACSTRYRAISGSKPSKLSWSRLAESCNLTIPKSKQS